MRRTARVMLLTAVLAGYSAPGDGVATPSTPTNTSRPPALPTAANGSDIGACVNGACEIAISGRQSHSTAARGPTR